MSRSPKLVVYGLHCACHPEVGIRYVGMTTQGMVARMSGHRSDVKKWPHWPVNKWKAKHGISNIRYEVLEAPGSVDELQAAEIRLIAEYRSRGLADLNVLDGGSSGRQGYQHTPEARARMSKSQRQRFATQGPMWRRKATPEERAAVSETTRRLWAEGLIDNRGAKNGGAKLTQEQVDEMRAMRGAATYPEIGVKFGIHPKTVASIMRGEAWATPAREAA